MAMKVANANRAILIFLFQKRGLLKIRMKRSLLPLANQLTCQKIDQPAPDSANRVFPGHCRFHYPPVIFPNVPDDAGSQRLLMCLITDVADFQIRMIRLGWLLASRS
jgi:hypothetical protein